MKILHRDPRGSEYRLKVDNLDDLWHLTNILEKGDLAYGLTYRREEKKDNKIRTERAEKKKLKIGIRVESWKYHDFADILRISGIIEDAPFDLGSYHTLNIKVDSKLTIIKNNWKKYQLQCLDEAVKSAKQPIVTFVALDDEKALIATLHQYGIKTHGEINGPGSGKAYEGKDPDMGEFYGQVLSQLIQVHDKNSPLIIIGPAFYKDEFRKFGEERELDLIKNAVIENTNHIGLAGIQEAMKRGAVTRVVKNVRVGIETEMVEEFLIEISKNGLFSYGTAELKNALDAGAVENLLITNEFVRTEKGQILMDKAKATGAKVMIISSVHEAGKKLEGFGGAGAILRYKLQV